MSGAILPPNPLSSKGQRYALVVGANSAPHIPHLSLLESAEKDALSVASVLQEHCDCTLVCEPLLGANATASAVRQALNTLAVRRTDDDILLFYFAGHGFIHEDPSGQRQVYLATSDLDTYLIQEGEDIESISLGWLRERLYEKTKAGRVLLILDCCYAGNMGRIPGDLPLNTIFDLFKHYLGATNDVSLRKYRVTIAATGHDAEASEKNDHSMTNHLLAVLRGECHEVLNQNGEVTIGRLYDYLHQIMPAEQKPSFSGDTAGRGLVLATYGEYSAQVLQTQQWASQREERRERLQILSAAPDGERFLRDRLESFVGRETELHDIQQRITAMQPSGGYVTITGQAGQGKSSVIAALIAQYASTSEERDHIPFHFIPFNPGPEYQVTLLRNLMARLILKYELSDLYITSEYRPALRDFFPKVLTDVAAKGGQEIIFIDGLDQIESDLNGVRDLSFLPTNPPESIVFVLGTRPDDTLKPLTLLKPTQSYLLPPLSRNDFSMLLHRRLVPPLEQRLADQFYNKMQQNALYLDLLAIELYKLGPITPDAIETIIHRLTEDPNNIFSLAIERLERRGDWREVIKPLLGVLFVAYEPLTSWQLRTILNLDHQQVQNGLQALSGLVTHIEQRYALYHLKFQDFLRQDETQLGKPCLFATDEETEYHVRLVQWCEHDQPSLIWEDTRDSKEQSRRIYVRHHYISHLYAARQWEHLFAVLDERSYGHAKEYYDVGARSYIQDLKKGCLAATWGGWTDEQHLKYVPHIWRYTLLRCSIRSTANQYPLELFKVMLVLGKEREVAGLIELITKPDKKVQTLLLLAQHLSQSLERKQEGAAIYLRSEEVARSLQDPSQQVETLTALATSLAQTQQWKQAEEVARSLQDPSRQAEALIALATALAQDQQGENAKRILLLAEKVAHSLQGTYEQARALTALAAALALAQQWKQAEEVARSLQDASQQARALTALAITLVQAQQGEHAKRILSQAENVVRSIQGANQQARALTALATVLVQAQQGERAKLVLLQAEEVAHSIWDPARQARALTALATVLVQAQQRERAKLVLLQAEEVAHSIWDPARQAEALASLATVLVQAQQGERAKQILSQAEEVARSLQDANQQAEALAILVTALVQAEQWKQAGEIAHSLQDPSRQAEALATLATALARAEQWKQAEEVARSLQDANQQAEALTILATALAQAKQWQQAGEVAHSIWDLSWQAEALMALATALAQAQQGESAKRVFSQTEKVVRSIQGSYRQVQSLATLATALARAEQWKQAEEVARSLHGSSQQTQALTVLAAALAQARQWKQAEKVIRSLHGSSQQAETLMALATALTQAQQWKRAEEVARSLQGSSQQTEALMALATALVQAQQWKQAEEVARSLQGSSQQTEALMTLATALVQAQQRESAKRILSQAEEVARSIQDANQQAWALMALATALAQAQQWKRAEEVARSIQDPSQQTEALMALATVLAQAQQRESAKRILSQAEEVARSLQDANQQAWALMALATALAQAQQWKRAEEVARSIQDPSHQTEALIALATVLTEQGHYSHLLSFVQRSWKRERRRFVFFH